jgi:hypothetical protein
VGIFRSVPVLATAVIAAAVLVWSVSAGAPPDSPTDVEQGLAPRVGMQYCRDVPLGYHRTAMGGFAWTAVDINEEGTSCETARAIVGTRARMNLGDPGGTPLPSGWACDGGGTCRRGDARVSWALAYRDPVP